MMAYGDYSCWSRYLPLGNWMTMKLGRIIEKEIISPEICCRNVQFEMKLQDITHTWCSMVFARSLNKAIRQRKALLSMGFGKMSINFHVPSLIKCQLVSLIFKNTEWLSQDGQKFFNSHCQKKCTFRILFSYFILRILALVIGSCDPA